MVSLLRARAVTRTQKDDRTENLGWLASGSFLPRKRKPIENITQSSLVFLEAEKAKLKSETAFRKPSTTTGTAGGTTAETTTRGKRPTKRISKEKRELLKENKGVRERNLKDVRDEEREKTTLETKASLYEKLSKDDDLGGTTTMKVPKDGFDCMDFRRKRLEEKEKEEYEYDFGSTYERRRYAGREDEDEDEEERERNEFREQRRREDEEREAREFRDEEKREKERRLVEDVARETEAARREREEAKMETVEAREKLKRKFIEEKIAQLKEKKAIGERGEKEEGKDKRGEVVIREFVVRDALYSFMLLYIKKDLISLARARCYALPHSSFVIIARTRRGERLRRRTLLHLFQATFGPSVVRITIRATLFLQSLLLFLLLLL